MPDANPDLTSTDRADDPIGDVCLRLRAYLAAHPEAADTADGIAMWWLADARASWRGAVLEAALQRLADEGLLDSRMLPSSRRLWFARPQGPR